MFLHPSKTVRSCWGIPSFIMDTQNVSKEQLLKDEVGVSTDITQLVSVHLETIYSMSNMIIRLVGFSQDLTKGPHA